MSLFALFFAAAIGAAPGTPDPEPVVGGTNAAVCEFPAAASGLRGNGSHACTVVVVHPRVVMLAAHCVVNGNLSAVAFGESVETAPITIAIDDCDLHPGFAKINDLNALDLAYCTLTEDAPNVPIVPPLMGCEADQLVPGASVTLPGYGLDDEANATGAGVKRWVINTVESVDLDNNDLFLLGDEGASVCFGDSGGPAYLQLDDGTWRVVGITSESHPDVQGQPLVCGFGAIYDLVHLEMAWIEDATGFDLTPCFDADGTWAPDENCGGFPTSVTTAGLTWDEACVSDGIAGPSSTCGPAFGDMGTSSSTGGETDDPGETETGETSTGGPADTSTSGLTEGGVGTADETTGPPPDETTSSGTGTGTTTEGFTTAQGTGTSAGGSDTDGTGENDGGGCGCRSKPAPESSWLVLLLVGLLRRRRHSRFRDGPYPVR